jgi:hypothetical protein
MFRLCGDFSDDFSGGFDFLNQAHSLSGEEVHGLNVTNSIAGRWNSSESPQRHPISSETNFADDRLICPLLGAAFLP